MSPRPLRVPAVLLALALTAAPALAQTPMEDPLDARDARRVDRMEKVVRELRDIVFKAQRTGAPVVVQPADTDARMADLSQRIADLEQSLTRINGSLETTQNELTLAKRENEALKSQVGDLTTRLTAAEQRVAEPPPPPEPPAEAAAGDGPKPPANEAFAAARQLMLSGDYDAAEQAFAAYAQDYPQGPRLAEARYWLGKTQTVRNAHAQAAASYIGAVRGWPQTTWAPDAVVELARSLAALKKTAEACQALAELPRRYPKASAAVNSRAATTRAQAKCAA
ncbi:tol-pal system protein YbgF [Phenylobacterium sp.]|jgi:tol-pal system protein YbgF|uniref:tol-pal system protein YbgF n=1 Tax=Phenylobacterium sp. TaxID=1871053 RepID=UPI003783FE34